MLSRDDIFTVTRCFGHDVQRTCRKTYVDVLARVRADGTFLPLAVLWPDGRRFVIDQVMAEDDFGATVKGWKTKTYHLRFGAWHTELHLELDVKTKTYRWWVWAFDNASPNPLKEQRNS